MTWLAICAALGLFVWSLKLSRAVENTAVAVTTARAAMTSLMDPTLTDDEKERAARSSAGRLFMHSASIALRLALALVVPTIFLAALVLAQILKLPSIIHVLESWEMIAASTLAVGVALFWKR